MKRQEKDTGYQFCVFFAQYIAIKIIVRLFTLRLTVDGEEVLEYYLEHK